MTSGAKSQAREWLESIVIAVVIAIVIKAFVFETVLVEGSSMLPTLKDSDRLAVNKIGYLLGKPEHGDIVVFEYPSDPSLIFIKRVIAVEGDSVEIKDHRVYVNGTELEEPYISEKPLGDFPEVVVPPNTVFVLGDNRNDSRDSRYADVGFIPLKNIRGEAVFRLWPVPPTIID
ncbi:MAG: signal peptidase I [Clostridiales bacterium]|jgi:signal peptidase I|nr:signal peptidase I [Clostridiales bacterium]